MLNTDTLSAAREDFRRARQQAALQELMARVTGQSIDLLAFEEVRRKLRATAMSERGLQDIPVSAIVGSAGRYTDFTRDFLPRAAVDEVRWARVKQAAADAGGLPPIEVYQVGDAYFVRDGHHRVSVARAMGVETIAAYVTEVRAKVPLSPEHQPDDLIRMAEYAEFLEATRLDELRPGADLSVSALGQYQRLLDHIEVHRYVVETESGRSLSDDEAVVSWYDQAYLPIVQVIRERGLLRDFPGRTETDLYLWLVEHAAELREELGWPVKPQAVAEELAAQFSPRRRRWGQRVLNLVTAKALVDGPAPGAWRKDRLEARYLERLFPDVLVPVSGEPEGWRALDQALVFARREGARLLGLHVVGEEVARTGPAAQAVRAEFGRRCAEAGAEGTLVVDAGEVAERICARAALADLVIVNLAHPPGAGPLERLSSGFRALVRRCPRPLLAVPRAPAAGDRLLLAFDGSPKAREALFVAAYLAGEWKSALTVITVQEGNGAAAALDFAHKYLEFHELSADFVEVAAGPVPAAILHTAAERECDLILMGGYGARPVVEVILGSSVDQVLRAAERPLLLCR